jgi:3-oxoacid CoA-transferase subunit A
VHRIVQGTHEKRIENRTTRKREAAQAEVDTDSDARVATNKKES